MSMMKIARKQKITASQQRLRISQQRQNKVEQPFRACLSKSILLSNKRIPKVSLKMELPYDQREILKTKRKRSVKFPCL